MEDFQYLPLAPPATSIRLIKLLRGDTIEVTCEVFHASISGPNAVPFEALSYAWGCTELVECITLNSRKLRITENLHSALQCLRSDNEDRILWIDAICINQKDLEERNQQVRQMGEIFRSASRVIFWLGKPTLEVELLMEYLRDLENHKNAVVAAVARTEIDHLRDEEVSLDRPTLSRIEDSYDGPRKGLRQLLKRPWFERVWILQEIANAQSAMVCCGRLSIPADVFSLASSRLVADADQHSRNILDIMPGPARSDSWWTQDQQRELINLNHKFSSSKASDERDAVFALLGMSSEPRDHELLRIDYRKPIDEVVNDIARYWLEVKCVPISRILDGVSNFKTIRATYLCFAEDWQKDPDDIIHIYPPPSFSQQVVECVRDTSRLLIEQYHEQSSDKFQGCYAELDGPEVGLAKLQNPNDPNNQSKYPDAFRVVYWRSHSQSLRILIITDPLRALIRAATNEWTHTFKFMLRQITWEKQEQVNEGLVRVAKSNSPAAVRMFLDHGAEINFNNSTYNSTDSSALIAASRKGHSAIVGMLLEKGADVNLTGRGTRGTALIAASSQGHTEVTQMLLSRGAVASIDYHDGYFSGSALVAAAAQHTRVLQLLLDYGADVNYEPVKSHSRFSTYRSPLMAASEAGNVQAVKILLDHGAKINACYPEYGSALELAAEWDCLEVVKMLVEYGADVNLSSSTERGSPLGAALAKNAHMTIGFLRKHGAK